jgi:phage terminase small subunit
VSILSKKKEDKLTNKQELFCLYFVKSFNATKAYRNAYDCSYNTAMVEGCKSLRNPKIKSKIEELKNEVIASKMLTKEDVVEKYMRIAFADITDYIEFEGSNEIDGTIIRKVIKQNGINIVLEDRMKALQWLSDYMMILPMHQHKKEYDELKLEIALIRAEAQLNKNGESEIGESDGSLINALKACAEDAFNDYDFEGVDK